LIADAKEALHRLNDLKYKHLHDSEVVFLHKISKEDIKFQVTLQDLFDRDLLTLLPELEETDEYYGRYLWPKRIRERIFEHCDGRSEKIAERFKHIFCILTQRGSRYIVESLKSAQLLMDDDPLIRTEVREDRFRMLLEEQDALTRRPRRRPATGRKQNVRFADDNELLNVETGMSTPIIVLTSSKEPAALRPTRTKMEKQSANDPASTRQRVTYAASWSP
jgi:hypothetical protein